jgi:hypothetical protein
VEYIVLMLSVDLTTNMHNGGSLILNGYSGLSSSTYSINNYCVASLPGRIDTSLSSVCTTLVTTGQYKLNDSINCRIFISDGNIIINNITFTSTLLRICNVT